MTTKSNFLNLWKISGLVYLIISCVVMAAMAIIMILFTIKAPELIASVVFLAFPLLGIFVGHWIRIGKYGWWRIILMVLSFIFFGIFLLFIFWIAPNLKDLETRQAAPAANAFDEVESLTQQFFRAIYLGDIDRIREYLDRGLNVNVVNEQGSTALHVTRNKEIIKMLIAKGANVNAVDDYGMTPMFSKDVYLVKMLVEDGADVNVRSEDGNTPLIWYTYSGYQAGVAYMISLGADINAVNNDGSTAYDIAERFEHFEILEYLKKQGAKSGKELQ